jgi:hypothetical protein
MIAELDIYDWDEYRKESIANSIIRKRDLASSV